MTHILEAAHQVLLDQCGEAIAIIDARLGTLPVLAANRACRALFPDVASGEGERFLDRLAAQLADRDLRATIRQMIASGEAVTWRDVPLRHAPERDEVAYWEWHFQPVRDRNGAIAQIVLMLTDTTPQRSVAHERRLHIHPAEQLPLAFALTAGPTHTVTIANEQLAALLGVARHDLIGRPFVAQQAIPATSRLAALLDETFQTGGALSIDELVVGIADGEERSWNLRLQAIPGLDERIGGVMILIADVTARVRERAALSNLAEAAHNRADELGAVLGAVPDGLLILDRDGVVVRANEAATLLLGAVPPLQGRPACELLLAAGPQREDGTPYDPERALIGPALRGERRVNEQVRLGDGNDRHRERVLAITATPVRHEGNVYDGAIVVIRDITAQKRTEQEKDAFLSLISHEIKSPLTSIIGFAQLALRAIEAEDESQRRATKHLHVIEQQADRISRLISDLSDVARLQRGGLAIEPTVFDLVAVTRTIIEQQSAAIRTHRVALTVPEEPLIVRADPRRVQQLVANLLTNAAKYSPQADTIAVSLAQHGDQARLAVQDWGIGIPADEQPRIFDRFFRAAGGGASGLGLGLFIAHQIAAQSGGTLSVESEEGTGSTFRLDLPLAQPGEDDE